MPSGCSCPAGLRPWLAPPGLCEVVRGSAGRCACTCKLISWRCHCSVSASNLHLNGKQNVAEIDG
eukprot:scaffold1533_cov388-Prasinococcus_capsulatus_cf.AAC.3